jgi:hypothetical protein
VALGQNNLEIINTKKKGRNKLSTDGLIRKEIKYATQNSIPLERVLQTITPGGGDWNIPLSWSSGLPHPLHV